VPFKTKVHAEPLKPPEAIKDDLTVMVSDPPLIFPVAPPEAKNVTAVRGPVMLALYVAFVVIVNLL